MKQKANSRRTMKKILFVINTMGRAGAETALIELLKKLTAYKKEYQIDLFVMLPQGELFSRLPNGVRVLNKSFSCESVLSSRGRLKTAFYILKKFFYHLTGFRLLGYFASNCFEQLKAKRFQPDKLLWRLVSDGSPSPKEEYDLAVAYLEGASTYFVSDKVRAKKKACFIHIDYRLAGYTERLDKGCYDSMSRIFVVSDEVGKQFLNTYPQHKNKICLFHNFLDVEGIREKAEKGIGFKDDYTGVRLVTVGRLHYQKAYDIAIKALRILIDSGRDIRWYVLGEGPERAALEKQIDETGLKDRFLLMGAKDNPYPYVKQADIYVHATRFEGKSIAIEEAQILGKVIVASDCTGNTEQIIPEYDGVLLPLDAEKLACELARVLDDGALRKRLSENVMKKNFCHDEDLKKLFSLLD